MGGARRGRRLVAPIHDRASELRAKLSRRLAVLLILDRAFGHREAGGHLGHHVTTDKSFERDYARPGIGVGCDLDLRPTRPDTLHERNGRIAGRMGLDRRHTGRIRFKRRISVQRSWIPAAIYSRNRANREHLYWS